VHFLKYPTFIQAIKIVILAEIFIEISRY